MAPDMQAAFIRATHRTSLYPRDLFSIMLSGGLAWIVGADGKRYYPMATKQAVSESLDVISQVPSYTLIRGPTFRQAGPTAKSEERRVGIEWVSTFKTRWSRET